MNDSASLIETIIPVLIFALVALVVLGVFAFKTQNALAPLRERVNEAASNVRTTVQKRNRLIKQLMDVVAAYAAHEKSVHERISADFNTPEKIEHNPSGALAYVTRLVNTFPELRADRNYLDLTSRLHELESELQQKHELHSASVRTYNSLRHSFPHDLFGSLMGFGVGEHLVGTEFLNLGAESEGSATVVRPRVGMKFRDSDGSLAEITKVSDDVVFFVCIPSRGGNPDGVVDKTHWIGSVAQGRYQIE